MKRQINRSIDIKYDLDGCTLANAITFLSSKIIEVGSNARIDISTDYSYGDQIATVTIEYQSEETDKEYEERIKEEQRRLTQKEDAEKLQYQKLKEKYG